MHRGDSKICRPTADRHSTCSVLNKTAPCTRADGTQSIRTRFLRLFPCTPPLIVLLSGAHSNVTANRRLCCSVRISVRTAVVIATTQVAVVGPRAHNRVESGTNEQPCSCCYGTDLKARPLHLISQRPILGHCLSGTWRLAGTFRDCEKPAKVPTGSQESDGLPLSKR